MSNVQVIEFQKEYPIINLELEKNSKKEYDMAIMVAYTMELEKGFIVKRQNKTTRKGTKFTYKPCETEEEFKDYKVKLNEMLGAYNKKYGTDYTW